MAEGPERKIILIGYRCTGKTTIGKELADRLGLNFIDTDVLAEAKAGMTIQEMISKKGWDFFREKEREAIRTLNALGKSVVATGGGAILDESNAVFLKKEGVLIWLVAGEETILKRMRGDAVTFSQRPPLSSDELSNEIATTVAMRTPLYRRLADFTVNTDAAGIAECVHNIEQMLLEQGLVCPL
ncbi:MAG: shikimate kinase [Syntrophales bacterium]